jgi:hypothetical protein
MSFRGHNLIQYTCPNVSDKSKDISSIVPILIGKTISFLHPFCPRNGNGSPLLAECLLRDSLIRDLAVEYLSSYTPNIHVAWK